MNIKRPIGSIVSLLSQDNTITQIYNLLKDKSADLLFAEPETGAGFLQWKLPERAGSTWQTISEAGSPEQKSRWAEEHKKRCDALRNKLPKDMASVLNVPSEDFFFFRESGDELEVALTAWGFRFPNSAPCQELVTYITKVAEQEVNIAFEWDGVRLANYPFLLSTLPRQTDTDGWLHVDGKLKVGRKFDIRDNNGHDFQLVVEQGKANYVFDITQFATVEVTVKHDDKGVAGKVCELQFDKRSSTLVTDENGLATLRLPLVCDPLGRLIQPQPAVTVKVDEEAQRENPSQEGDVLHFDFVTHTEVPPVVVVPEEPEIPEEPKKEESKPRKRRSWWWLLLLLLPFLLLIKCSKDIEVDVVETNSETGIEDMPVTLEYTTHYLFADGQFLRNDTITRTETTDENGHAEFKDLPCSVFSYIFYCLSKASLSASDECHADTTHLFNFHYTRHVTLEMEPRTADLHIRVLDLETGDPLPDGMVVYQYEELGAMRTDSVQADANGVATLPKMRICSTVEVLTSQCYGYADTTRTQIEADKLVTVDDSLALRLRPIKERFTFFVRNINYPHQPIPDAECVVTLTHPGQSHKEDRRTVHTSIDGKGIAPVDSAFMLSTIHITAHKTHYRDSVLTGGSWIVEKFKNEPDSIRTIWLTPEPFTEELICVDSITGKPVEGAKNHIIITHPDGTREEHDEISNRNGAFPVQATEDDHVEIISDKNGEYKKHRTDIPVFKDLKDKKIPLSPEMVDLALRTVLENTWEVLPGCALSCTGSISGKLQPSNSGNGNFTVQMRRVERLSITASKTGYETNSTKIKNNTYDELVNAPTTRRDIPLRINLPPCEQRVDPENGQNNHVKSYAMGTMKGRTTIDIDLFSEADVLTVYDGTTASGTPIFGPKTLDYTHKITVDFTQAAITIAISGSSCWKYTVHCP